MAHRMLRRIDHMRMHARRQGGYSLIEMLVVVAIVGIMSLVAVPNFITMYRASKLKTSMRQFATDVRGARQRAAARNSFVKVSFDAGVAPGTYRIFESTSTLALTSKPWTQISPITGSKKTEAPVSFENVTFDDVASASGTDSAPDVIFQSNGTAIVPDSISAALKIKSSDAIPVRSYTITVTASGKISAK